MQLQTQSFQTRQNMLKNTFEVFRYRDSIPESVAVHHHDFYEIYFFLSGEVEYRVEGKTYLLTPGDLLLINPRELHQPIVKPDCIYERIVLWIDKSYIESFGDGENSLTRCFDIHSPTHTNILRPTGIQRNNITELLESLINESYGDDYANELFKKASQQNLSGNLSEKGVEDFLNKNLSEAQANAVKDLLADEEKTKALLNSDAAKALFKRFFGGKGNG